MTNIVPGDLVKVTSNDPTKVKYCIWDDTPDQDVLIALFDDESLNGIVLAVTTWGALSEDLLERVQHEIADSRQNNIELGTGLSRHTTTYVVFVIDVEFNEKGSELEEIIASQVIIVPNTPNFLAVQRIIEQ